MILYADTSALVKLYIEEPGTTAALGWVAGAREVVTAGISYAEARAAFARHRREGALTASELRRIVEAFDQRWLELTRVGMTDGLIRRAGVLAERRSIRGYDAIQLAAALVARDPKDGLVFACFDARLNRAARSEGFRLADA